MHALRSTLASLHLAALAAMVALLALAGCGDDASGEPANGDDPEMTNVVWHMVAISDDTGDVRAAFEATYERFDVLFYQATPGTGFETEAELRVVGQDLADNVWVYGDYTLDLDTGTGSVSLDRKTVVGDDGPQETTLSIEVPFNWSFDDADRLVIVVPASPLNDALGTAWTGTLTVTFVSEPILS